MRWISVAVALVFSPASVLAQPPGSETPFGEIHYVGDTEVELVIEPAGRVRVRTASGEVTVHDGGPAFAWAAANDRGLMVALIGAAPGPQVSFVPISDGRAGTPRSSAITHRSAAHRAPVGAAVTARPDGFAVFFQEAHTQNPSEAYQTFIARFDPDGAPRGPAELVHAVWPIADVLYLPSANQYYFLLFYGHPSFGTRLAGVHIREAELTNVEHPFWVSPAGGADEARLFLRGDRVMALYRDGAQLFASDVTTGQWGREPPPPRSHGTLGPTDAFGARSAPGADRLAVRRHDVTRPLAR